MYWHRSGMAEGKRSVGSGLTAAVLCAGVAGFDVHRRVDAVAASASHGQQGFEVSCYMYRDGFKYHPRLREYCSKFRQTW